MTLRLKIAVSASLLALLAFLLPWGEVLTALRRLPPERWGLVLAGFLAGHALGVLKWRTFVATGRALLRPADAIRCYAAGLFANLCLPSIVGGDVLRMVMAGRITRRPEAALWGGVLDRVTDVLSLGILLAGGGLAVRASLPGWQGELLGGGLLAGLGAALIAFLVASRTRLHRWPRRLRRPVGRSLVAFRRLRRRPGIALGGLAISLIIQGGFVLLNAWMGHALGIDIALGVWFFAWPLAKLAGLVPISLGGLAVREASLAGLLAPFGVPFGVAVLESLLWQTVLIAGGLLGGAAWLILGRVAGDPATGSPSTLLHERPHA